MKKNYFILKLLFNKNQEFLINSILFLFLSLFFLGCLNYEETLVLNSDYSGTMIIHYWIKNMDEDSTGSKNNQVFSKDKIKKELNAEGVEIKSIDTFFKENEQHAKITLTFDSISNLNKTSYFNSEAFILKNGAAGQMIFERKIGGSVEYFGFEGFKYSFYYSFPSEIITDNSDGKVGDYLKWEFDSKDLINSKTLSITFTKPESQTKIIIIIIITLIFIIFVSFIIYRWNILKSRKLISSNNQ